MRLTVPLGTTVTWIDGRSDVRPAAQIPLKHSRRSAGPPATMAWSGSILGRVSASTVTVTVEIAERRPRRTRRIRERGGGVVVTALARGLGGRGGAARQHPKVVRFGAGVGVAALRAGEQARREPQATQPARHERGFIRPPGRGRAGSATRPRDPRGLARRARRRRARRRPSSRSRTSFGRERGSTRRRRGSSPAALEHALEVSRSRTVAPPDVHEDLREAGLARRVGRSALAFAAGTFSEIATAAGRPERSGRRAAAPRRGVGRAPGRWAGRRPSRRPAPTSANDVCGHAPAPLRARGAAGGHGAFSRGGVPSRSAPRAGRCSLRSTPPRSGRPERATAGLGASARTRAWSVGSRGPPRARAPRTERGFFARRASAASVVGSCPPACIAAR